MNKQVTLICAAMLIAGGAPLQAADPVYSVNVMGFQKVPVPAQGLNVAGAPYYHDSNDINRVIGPQMTPGVDLNTGDSIYFFDVSNQTYEIAYLRDVNGNLLWVDNESQNVSTSPVPPGMGFWIKNNQQSNQNLYVTGEVITSPTYTSPVAPGLQLLSYPYSALMPVGALSLAGPAVKGETLDSADAVYLWNQDLQRFQIMYYYSDGSLVDFATGDPVTNVLKPGTAFWYKHLGGGFDWVETNRYSIH
jgi:hypothetical protein